MFNSMIRLLVSSMILGPDGSMIRAVDGMYAERRQVFLQKIYGVLNVSSGVLGFCCWYFYTYVGHYIWWMDCIGD